MKKKIAFTKIVGGDEVSTVPSVHAGSGVMGHKAPSALILTRLLSGECCKKKEKIAFTKIVGG